MKRFFSILLIMALFMGIMPMMENAALAESYATVTSTNGYGVRLREGPSKAYRVVTSYKVGTTVLVLQRGAEWSQLQVGSTVGWMLNEYLNFGATGAAGGSGAATSASGTANATVKMPANGLRVWLRATPGGKRLFLNAAGTSMTVLEHGNSWCKVMINGTIGYMMTEYVDLGKKETPAPAPTKIKSVTINYPSPVVMDTLSAKISPEGVTATYSWQVSKSKDGPWREMGTESTFYVHTSLIDKGTPWIRLQVKGTGSTTGTATDTCTDPVQISKGIKSVKLSNPTPLVGQTLSAILQPSSAIVDYSWRVGGTEVSNEATYTVQPGDLDKLVQLKVTGIGGYVGSAACSATANVASDKALQSIELSKTAPVVGDTLSAAVSPSGASVKYVWIADGENVSTAATYKITELDLGKKITVQVTGVEPYSGTVSATTANVASATLTEVKISNNAPTVGDILYAVVKPENASAIYVWKADDAVIQESVSTGLKLNTNMTDSKGKNIAIAGKKITVTANGIGVYNGSVTSGATNDVLSDSTITSVALTNTTPVIGDTITAVVTPKMTIEEAEKLTYVWKIDTETSANHSPSYSVGDSDNGKRIRVQVIGANGYTGEAYSAWTDPVLWNTKLSGVTIYNESIGKSGVTPEVGQTLRADVSPYPSMTYTTMNYVWTANGVTVGTGREYVVKADDNGKVLKVTVTGDGIRYVGTVSAQTAAVIALKPVTVNLTVSNPVAGKKPSYSVAVSDAKQCKATLQWLEGGVPAELDAYGYFKPSTAYTAKIFIYPEAGYTMTGAQITVNTEKVIPSGIVVVKNFDATATMEVTDYYITDLDKPVIGEKLDTKCSNSQVSGTVSWNPPVATGVDMAGEFVATIQITPNSGYDLSNVPNNAFKVNGADSTTYVKGSGEIVAKYKISHVLSIKADKDRVVLDGVHRNIVQCTAYMSNYVGFLEGINWEVISPNAEATTINDNGTLVVGSGEQTGRVLQVRATIKLGGKEYTATLNLPVESGAEEDAKLKVTFNKSATQIERGSEGYFEATVANSIMGCTMYALFGKESPVEFYDWLYVPDTCEYDQVIVKAVSNEDRSVIGTTLVSIVDDPDKIVTSGEPELDEIKLAVLEAPVLMSAAAPEQPETAEEASKTDEEGAEGETGKTEEAVAEGETAKTDEVVITIKDSTDETEEAPKAPEANETEEAPKAPEADETEEAPKAPEADETEEVPKAPEADETEEAPKAPEADETEEAPKAPEADETEEAPKAPEADETEEAAKAPEAGETEEAPKAPEANVTEEAPKANETDETEEAAKAPEADETEEAAKAPEISETEEAPKAPEAGDTEEAAKAPEADEIDETEEAPKAPEADEADETPKASDVKEPEAETLTGPVLNIRNNATGEIVETVVFDQPKEETKSEEPEAVQEEPSETKKTSKKTKVAKEEAVEPDDEDLDALDDADMGESSADSAIKILFVEKPTSVKRGASATFKVKVEGSEQGVRWSVRSSKDADGKAVSSITQEGVLTVSEAETSEKLSVVATSLEDGSVRAHWSVAVPKKSNASKDGGKKETADAQENAEEPVSADKPETAAETETPSVKPEAEEDDYKPEKEGLTPDQLKQVEEELRQIEEASEVFAAF